MPLFGKSSKNPGEVVRQLKESLLVLEKQHNGESQKKLEKAHDDVRNCPCYFKTSGPVYSIQIFLFVSLRPSRENNTGMVFYSKYIFTISSLLFSPDSDQQSDIILGEL